MTTNSQLSITKPKKPKTSQANNWIQTGIDSQNGRSHGGLSAGRGVGRMGEKVQGIRRINGSYKIDRGR